MRPFTLAYLYLRRLRTHPVQELLAGLGVTIGVALTCAVQIANHSVTGSATETVRDLGGSSALQLSARGPRGVDQTLVAKVRALPAVELATGLLEQRAVLTSRAGRSQSVHVIGAQLGPDELGGLLRARVSIAGLELRPGIVLPRALAATLDAIPDERTGRPRPSVELRVRGRKVRLPVTEAPGRDRVGSFANGRTAVMPRAQLQRIARLPGRVTRVLVEPRAGQQQRARRQLAALAGGRLTVGQPRDELDLLEHATGPSDRASTFFTLIAGLVGWLLAFNAMLLSAPERRRAIAELRLQGFRHRQLVQIALFQAALLGVVASAAGLLAGDLLARGVLAESSDYLAGAFSFGTQTVVPRSALVLSFAAGVLAAGLAAAPPLIGLRRRDAVGTAYRDAAGSSYGLSATTQRRLALASLLAVGVAVAQPSATAIVAILALALALLLALPAVVSVSIRGLRRLTQRAAHLTMAALGLLMLQGTTLRSLALAATAALAVFGSVAVSSAREDLLRGIKHFSEHYAGSADLWVVHPDDIQTTKDFPADKLQRRLARLPQLAAVRPYQGGYLDLAGQRVWLIARSLQAREPIPRAEMIAGSFARVRGRLQTGRW
ncbi:MAG TPA: ABC transporter permease, partial [Thermoleophilaceae bacterium]